jgi:hypothetical protein
MSVSLGDPKGMTPPCRREERGRKEKEGAKSIIQTQYLSISNIYIKVSK